MKKNLFRTASILCYCLSLVFPAFLEDKEIGLYFLLWGWLSLANPIGPIYLFVLPWIANFTYFLNLILINKINVWIQIMISITTIVFSTLIFIINEESFQMDLGAWFWGLSFIVLLIGQIQIIVKLEKDAH